MSKYDAVVVGGGPNGLAAAVALARAGRSVLVIEGHATIGGGARTLELTLPGFRHDPCSAVHPMAAGSPFLRTLPLDQYGLHWVQPGVPFAHPLSPNEAVMLHRSVTATAAELDPTDAVEYRRRIEPLLARWNRIELQVMGPMLRIPRHPAAFARFAAIGALPATSVLKAFTGARARALFAGCAAHSYVPLRRPLTTGFALVMMVSAHAFGWPFAAGGSQAIVDALGAYLLSLGGEIETGRMVTSLDELPPSKVVLCDVVPSGLARIAGDRLSPRQRRQHTAFRHGPAAFKLDYALSGPVPWLNPALAGAGTIHLGGTAEDIIKAEDQTWHGKLAERPFALLAQPSLFDPSRAPAGQHVLWAYAHVPHGFSGDVSEEIERRIEALAPGFRGLISGRCVSAPADLEAYNPNLVGGDVSGGAHTVRQMIFRPYMKADPYVTPIPGVYLCSSATPPGAGAHGMCGYWAARSALSRELK